MIRPGEMNHRPTVERATFTENDLGERLSAWAAWQTVWAKVEPVGAREAEFARSFAPTVSHKVTIRYLPDLTSADRLNLRGRILAIDGIVDVEERHAELWLFCTEKK